MSAGLIVVSLPASAEWVFNTGETIAYPRSETVRRPLGNQTTSNRSGAYSADMIQETMPVQTSNGARTTQQQYNSNQGYSNQGYSNQQTAQSNTYNTQPNSNQQNNYRQQQGSQATPRTSMSSDPDTPGVRFLLSTWAGDGGLEWAHNARASEPAFGDPTSRLNYSGASSTILDLGVVVDIANGFYAELHYGSGDVDSGTLTDEDYLSPNGAGLIGVPTDTDVLFSSTDSTISQQDVSYYEVKFGRRLNTANISGLTLDAFAKFQHWKERYDAFGITQTSCIAPGVLCDPVGSSSYEGTNVITNTSQWQSLFLGLQADYEFLPGLNLKGSIAYSPRSEVTNDDVHQLRGDLRYDPSISIESTGSGYNYEVELSYNFWRKWSAFVGYRYWELSAGDDTNAVQFYEQPGVTGIGTKLNNIQIKRDGVTAGFGYNFKNRSL